MVTKREKIKVKTTSRHKILKVGATYYLNSCRLIGKASERQGSRSDFKIHPNINMHVFKAALTAV